MIKEEKKNSGSIVLSNLTDKQSATPQTTVAQPQVKVTEVDKKAQELANIVAESGDTRESSAGGKALASLGALARAAAVNKNTADIQKDASISNYYNTEAQGKQLANQVYSKYGEKNAALNFENDVRTSALNKEFGRQEKELSIQKSDALIRDLESDINNRNWETKANKITKNSALSVQADSSELKAREIAKEAEADVRRRIDFNPFGFGTSGEDNSRYRDETRALNGDKPIGTIRRILGATVPFMRAVQARDAQNKFIENRNKLNREYKNAGYPTP